MLYEIPKLEHVDARSVEEAIYWLHKYGEEAKVVAGGTDLLGLIKDGIEGPKMPIPKLLVNIKTIPGLSKIEYEEGRGLILGAATTLYDIETSEIIKERYPILAQAASEVATNQIRNMGTIGGNLCQRPWCWYFRVPHFNCYKKGGPQCFAITGSHKYYFSILGLGICVMAHPSDCAPALIALGSRLKIAGPEGYRELPVERFFNGPREVFETVLRHDEILTEIMVPDQPRGSKGAYVKSRIRGTWDFALASAAVQLLIEEDGRCSDAKIVLGGVAPYPYRCYKAEEIMKGRRVDDEVIREACEEALRRAHPLKQNGYKVILAKNVLKRAIERALGRSGQ